MSVDPWIAVSGLVVVLALGAAWQALRTVWSQRSGPRVRPSVERRRRLAARRGEGLND